MGTQTAKNYSSDVRLVDPGRNVDRDVHIWMNNPLRFAGETFYQQQLRRSTSTANEATTLQVVTNTGWMIPYVACMLVATGMLAQFSITLLRFLNRRRRSTASPRPRDVAVAVDGRATAEARRRRDIACAAKANAALVLHGGRRRTGVACRAAVLSSAANRSTPVADARRRIRSVRFGRLPSCRRPRQAVRHAGPQHRCGDFRTGKLYRPTRQDAQNAAGHRWLLDVITRGDSSLKHKVFRIENLRSAGDAGPGAPRRASAIRSTSFAITSTSSAAGRAGLQSRAGSVRRSIRKKDPGARRQDSPVHAADAAFEPPHPCAG